jgi:putative transposase
MPRLPRRLLVDVLSTNHCTWRAHNFSAVFESDDARHEFLRLLARYKTKHGVQLHGYCLMGTHPHVIVTSTRGQPAFSRFWKAVNQCFAQWFNRRNRRRGQVVMERLRSPMIQADGRHLLTVMRYGDLNPVKAGLVRSPKDWRWSSYRHYAFGERDPLIDDAPDYLALGRTDVQRRLAYQRLCEVPLVDGLMVRRRDLVDNGFIGDDAWRVSRRPMPRGS